MKQNEQIKRLKADSKLTMKALLSESLRSRFLIGSHNAVKLKKSLATVRRLDLAERTLLTPVVHKAHAKRLNERYQVRWDKIRDKAKADWSKLPKSIKSMTVKATDHEIAASHIRFLTLVDSVTAVDANAALRAATKFKQKLITTAEGVSGLTCLGAIEVEVVSMSLMRELGRLDKTTLS